MDIEVIIKKTLVFAGLSSFVIACFSIPLFLLPRLLVKSIAGEVQFWLLIVSGMAVAGLVEPVNRILTHITDKYLFQKKQEIKIILKNLSEKAVTILDLKQVGQKILSTLVDTFRLESGMIAIYDRKGQKFRLLGNSGLPSEGFVLCVKKYFNESGIQEYLKTHHSILSLDNPAEELPKNVSEWMNASKGRATQALIQSNYFPW
jgi:hypothetical protein